MKVTKIGMQGRQDYAQWVTKYRVAYSTDGQHFSVQNQVSENYPLSIIYLPLLSS